jgi:iron complex outermembrane receptor protein
MNKTYHIAIFASSLTQMLTSGYAYAQAKDRVTLEDDIVVTARRIEERLQDVPISISVVDQDRITQANVVSGEDLVKVVPGLNAQSKYGAENANFSIRGFTQEIQTSSSVGTYFAEVVGPRSGSPGVQSGDGAGPGSLFDLQNVQVLKGPQGTLFGRNTTGGAVLLTPKKPVGRFEGYVEGSYGNYDMRRIQAVLNVPLASWARVRLGVDRQKRDGYVTNVSGIGPDKFYDSDYYALRGSLVLDISPNIENYTIVSYLHSDTNGQTNQLFRANPNLAFGQLALAQVARLQTSGNRYQIEQHISDPRVKTEQFQIINTTTWLATDNLTIKNIASYSRYQHILRQDLFSTNFQFFGSIITTPVLHNPDGLKSADQNNVTEELQFQGTAMDSKLSYQFGAYYEHSTPASSTGTQLVNTGNLCQVGADKRIADFRCFPLNPLVPATANVNTGSIEFINMAAYAQATYALTDKLKLTGGLRYTYDRGFGIGKGDLYVFNAAGIAQNAGCQPTFQYVDCTQSPRTSTKRPTWTVNLAYNPTEDMMVYATYSRGYRQGAPAPFYTYPISASNPAGEAKFGPEKIDNFEAGLKASFQGPVSGNLNAAAFYSNLTDQQLLVAAISTVNGGTATSIFNAGKSRVYGFDLDASLRFASIFRLNGSVTYVNSKLVTFDVPTSLPGYDIIIPSAVAGDPLPYTPKWGVNLTGIVTLPVPEEYGKIEFAATYRYNSSFITGASYTNAVGTAVSQLDLNLDWRNIGGKPIDLGLFGSNVTNQFTATSVSGLYDSFGFDTRYLGRPRMYGVRAKWRFGE